MYWFLVTNGIFETQAFERSDYQSNNQTIKQCDLKSVKSVNQSTIIKLYSIIMLSASALLLLLIVLLAVSTLIKAVSSESHLRVKDSHGHDHDHDGDNDGKGNKAKETISFTKTFKGMFTLDVLPGEQTRINVTETIKHSFHEALKHANISLHQKPHVEITKLEKGKYISSTVTISIDVCSKMASFTSFPEFSKYCEQYKSCETAIKCNEAKKLLNKQIASVYLNADRTSFFQKALDRAHLDARWVPWKKQQSPHDDHTAGHGVGLEGVALTATATSYTSCTHTKDPSNADAVITTCNPVTITLPATVSTVQFLLSGTNNWNYNYYSKNGVSNVVTGSITFASPGVTFYLYIGNGGCSYYAWNNNIFCNKNDVSGGWNGGGNGNMNYARNYYQAGGDGGTDIRMTNVENDWSNRIVVAGGSGGEYLNANTISRYI